MALVYAAAFFLNLRTVLWLLNLLVPGLVIGLAIVFQPELRQIFLRIGQGRWIPGGGPSLGARQVQHIVGALEALRKAKRGALIVVMRRVGLGRVIESGTPVGAELSSALLISLFSRGSPLHDGAAIVDHDRVVAAGCFLPPSEGPLRRRVHSTPGRARCRRGVGRGRDCAVRRDWRARTSSRVGAHRRYAADQLRKRLEDMLQVTATKQVPARDGR